MSAEEDRRYACSGCPRILPTRLLRTHQRITGHRRFRPLPTPAEFAAIVEELIGVAA